MAGESKLAGMLTPAPKRWSVTATWAEGESNHEFASAKILKRFIDETAFCERHGCPMPLKVVIEELK